MGMLSASKRPAAAVSVIIPGSVEESEAVRRFQTHLDQVRGTVAETRAMIVALAEARRVAAGALPELEVEAVLDPSKAPLLSEHRARLDVMDDTIEDAERREAIETEALARLEQRAGDISTAVRLQIAPAVRQAYFALVEALNVKLQEAADINDQFCALQWMHGGTFNMQAGYWPELLRGPREPDGRFERWLRDAREVGAKV